GQNAVNTIFDGIYHIGFPLSADRSRLTNEDGDDNATLSDVARWLTALKEDLATSGSNLDRIVETIVVDPGLQAAIPWGDIRGGAQAANDLNGLILQGIAALKAQNKADRDDTRLSATEVRWINGWIQSDPSRYALFVNRHGDDENGSETGFHLVQNDGATNQLFGQNAVNTIFDGIYHIGFTINADGRFQNEDGDANALVSDVAEWITYYYGDPSTTGSGLDRLVDWIRLDPGLPQCTSALDVNDGLAAANSLNGIFLEAVAATGVNLDSWISRNDLRLINRWVRDNRYSAFVLNHGDDENGVETGFHKIQNDGATTQFFGQNLVNTVADGIFHYGFEIRGENFLNEDGDRNQSLSDVSGWVNYFLSNRRLSIGTDAGETIAGNGEDDQVLAQGGDDVVDGLGGADLLDGGWGNDILHGGAGRDQLDGSFGEDTLDGGEDSDTYLVSGFDPWDQNWETYSFSGFDTYKDSGSAGIDSILAQGSGPVDIGLAATFSASSGIEQIVNDTSTASGTKAQVRILGSWNDNVFDFTNIQFTGGNFLFDTGDGNDSFVGSANAEAINGGYGNDRISGRAGNDSITGGGGNDVLDGGEGSDTYWVSGQETGGWQTYGGTDTYSDSGLGGTDKIVATGASNVDIGLAGGNFLASNGIEQIVNNTAVVKNSSSRPGQVRLLGDWNTNTLNFSRVRFLGGDFVIDAGGANDIVTGSMDADSILAGQGVDTVNGGDGADTITGGEGLDMLTGGNGADTFVLTTLNDGLVSSTPTSLSFERITDFNIGVDFFDVQTPPPSGGFRILGSAASLTTGGLTDLLNPTNFVANGAATFTSGSSGSLRTFLAFNDGVAGFSGFSDAVVEITGYRFASGFTSLSQISII
ncbi:MAG: bluetail domain-containing putative surface protein, partial [Cyanobium sp.]